VDILVFINSTICSFSPIILPLPTVTTFHIIYSLSAPAKDTGKGTAKRTREQHKIHLEKNTKNNKKSETGRAYTKCFEYFSEIYCAQIVFETVLPYCFLF